MVQTSLSSVGFGMTAAELKFDDTPLTLIDPDQMISTSNNGNFRHPVRFTPCCAEIALLLEQRISAAPTLFSNIEMLLGWPCRHSEAQDRVVTPEKANAVRMPAGE